MTQTMSTPSIQPLQRGSASATLQATPSVVPSMASSSIPNAAPIAAPPPPPLHLLPQPIASSSRIRNPQLGPAPFFRYPTPSPDQIEDELPPYWENENVPLGPMLDRLVRKGHGDMRVLLEQTLPPLATGQKPKHIIEYAKTTRQAVLKYLAVLRWKTSVDLATTTTSTVLGLSTNANGAPASFPTPHSNSESNDTSPPAGAKGKARAAFVSGVSGSVANGEESLIRGKVTDARRVQQFLEHQNVQQEAAVSHIRHVTKLVETLRERNADVLTALTVLSTGTYTRLPSSLTESFIPRPLLNPPAILDTIGRLNEHLLYRIRCVDYLPPELVVEKVRDGRVHVRGGGKHGWRAELSVVGFDDDSRWWLTGLEWAWSGEGSRKTPFGKDERQQILDVVNMQVLTPQPPPEEKPGARKTVDSPLVRVSNFLQHLSLSCQMEVLFSQALVLSQGRWRGQLLVDIDRSKKELRIRYWVRPRPPAPPGPQAASAVGKRPQPTPTQSTPRTPLVGGTLTFALVESQTPVTEIERILQEVAACGVDPVDRAVRLEIALRWEVGEAGPGGGLKAGDYMDPSVLKIDPSALSVIDIVTTATRTHASHLSRAILTPLLYNTRITLDPTNPLSIIEDDSVSRPLALIVPLPARVGSAHLSIAVSAISGMIEIEDSGAKEGGQPPENNRTLRAKLATASVNDQKTRLTDDLSRLMSAIIMEDVEDQLRQLGMHPVRRVALRTNDLAKTDLHPTSTVFVPLPVSHAHYFVSKVTERGVAFELLKLSRVGMETGQGLKIAVGDRTPIELSKLVARREKALARKRPLDKGANIEEPKVVVVNESAGSKFQVKSKDLRDMFVYCNALVAQTIVEQQLKDRGIPYTAQFPGDTDFPTTRSRSAITGMVPNLCVDAGDLLKDGRAADVAAPKVYLVIKDWWKGGKCSVETIVRLRHRPSVSATDVSPAPAVATASSSAAKADGIKFDQASSTVHFTAPNIARCVPDFLEQWERLSKVIVVAGEVNRLNKTEQFRDIRMLSFDLRTATLQYAPGYNVAITYTPTSDSYEATCFRSSVNALTPAAIHSDTPVALDTGDPSPHQLIAPLLSHRLNQFTNQTAEQKRVLGSPGKQLIQLLRATLPILLEADSLRAASASDSPALVVRSVTEYRLVWDVEETTRHALDITLTADSSRVLISDASKPRPNRPLDLSCGPITPIPGLDRAISKGFQAARAAKVMTPGSVQSEAAATAMATASSSQPAAMRLDDGSSVLCSVNVVHEVLRAIAGEVERALAEYSSR